MRLRYLKQGLAGASLIALASCHAFGQEGVTRSLLSSLESRLADLHGSADEQIYAAESLRNERHEDPRIVPELETAFEHATVKIAKQQIAVALLAFKAKDEKYFSYLSSFARHAVESKAPFPFLRDPVTKTPTKQLDPSFLDWCKKNGKDWQSEAYDQLYTYILDLQALRYIPDRRSAEIFRQGLSSNLGMVRVQCISGLAELGDSADIEPSISSAVTGDTSNAHAFARALAIFVRKGHAVEIEKGLRGNTLLERVRAVSRIDDKQAK